MKRPPCPQCTNALHRAGRTESGATVWRCRWRRVVYYELPTGDLVAFGGEY